MTSGRHNGRRALTTEDREWVVSSYDRGVSVADLALWVGTSRATIQGILQEARRLVVHMDSNGMKPTEDGQAALLRYRRLQAAADQARLPVMSRWNPTVPEAAVFQPGEAYHWQHLHAHRTETIGPIPEGLRRGPYGYEPATEVRLVITGWR